MQRVAIITFYYSPDLCAGSFRSVAFVKAIRDQLPRTARIDVLTTMPNRYQSFVAGAKEIEEDGQLTIRRFKLPAHKSGLLDQSRSFLKYSWSVWRYTRNRDYDLVFATSSRLMTAALGATIAKRARAPLYLDIRDLFTDTMRNVLQPALRGVVLPVFQWIEKFTFGAADKINLVSRGFAGYFDEHYNDVALSFFSNGIDPEFITRNFDKRESRLDRRTVLYAGNIGEGQGLHKIIPDAARKLGDSLEFVVVGDGGQRHLLEELCADLDNVHLLAPVDRRGLLDYYSSADILFMHLNDYDAFKKVLPSKIFEYAATGKPVLAGVSGYAAQFTSENVENSAVFPPCDSNALVAAVGTLEVGLTDRHRFILEYARDSIMRRMAKDALSVVDT